MADEEQPQARLSFNLPKDVREKLQNVAFLLKKSEQALAAEAIKTWLDAVVSKKGEKFQQALKLVEEAKDA